MNQINEKWGTDYQTPKSKRGMFKGRSLASLEKQAKTAHGTKAKQVNFAIRAKKAHGGKWKGVTAEGEEMTNNPYQNMIVAAVEQKPDDFTQEFNAAIQEKLQGHVASFKEYLTATLLGDEPVEEEETVDEGETIDILEVFEMFLDNYPEDHFENLEEAVALFAYEVDLTEDEAVEFYDFLTEEEDNDDEEQIDETKRGERYSNRYLSTINTNEKGEPATSHDAVMNYLTKKGIPGRKTYSHYRGGNKKYWGGGSSKAGATRKDIYRKHDEETELNELSKKTLRSYTEKARKDLNDSPAFPPPKHGKVRGRKSWQKDYDKGTRRSKGLRKAAERLEGKFVAKYKGK